MTTNAYSLGIDIGGTFTDIVAYSHATGLSLSHKELTTADAPYKGVISGVQKLFAREKIAYADITRVIHATTLFTNALIERNGAPTGLITTAGFRDTLEMAREHKYELYDLHIELPKPLVPRHLRHEVPERTGPDGAIQTPLDDKAVLAAAAKLLADGVNSVAIVFLHSYANAKHEQRARDLIRKAHPNLFVSISSEVSPQIREYERSTTTVANAYITPLADSYLELMRSEIAALGIRAPLFMMLSNGGLTHVDEAKRVPIQLLESGPAAGALAGSFFGERSGVRDVLAFDMGGTTAKLAIIEDCRPLIGYRFEAGREKRLTEGSGLPISISTIELIEIGAGGGSIARLDELGLLKVGPQSAGSMPGPACYGRGGEQPTVTDANLVLGYLDPQAFAGGTMAIDVAKAEAAIGKVASKSGISVPELAWGIYSIVNENMAAAARVHVAERGHHAGKFALLLTGGGGPLHGCEVARRLGINRVLCPPGAGVASALGLLMAPARIDRMSTIAKRLGALDWAAFESAYRRLEDDARGVIAATLANPGVQPSFARAADLRFLGQGFEIVTDLPAGPYAQASAQAIRDAFFTAYKQTFGQVPPVGEIEVVNIRVAVTATAGNSDLRVPTGTVSGAHAVRGTRKVWVGAQSAYVDVPVYERESLAVGQVLAGPGVIQEPSSTLVLPAGSRATVDASGSIVVDLGFAPGFTAAPSADSTAAVQ